MDNSGLRGLECMGECESMLFRFHGRCQDCGHEWEGLRRRLACGRIDLGDPDSYQLFRCATCFVELFLPRQLSRAGWLRWVSQNASELTGPPLYFTACELGVRVDMQSLDVISRSPLLFRVCERVSSILAGTRSRYLPVPIDLGSLECPDCGDQITNHEGHADNVVCPECTTPRAVATSEEQAGVVLVDYTPLAAGDVRRMILHLEQLAEPPKENVFKGLPMLSELEGIEPLWDRQLDG
jgi:hypothetical protein